MTTLIDAVSNQNLAQVQELIASGADVNQVSFFGYTPLSLAVARKNKNIMNLLLAAGANVNITTNQGESALFIAAQVNADIEIVNTLIAAGANVNSVTLNGITPLWFAASRGNKNTVNALIQAGADVNISKLKTTGSTALHEAAEGGYVAIVKALTQAGADVNSIMLEGETALFLAAKKGKINTVNALIAAGADVNKTLPYNQTPLYAAAKGAYEEIVIALIAAGADVNIDNPIWVAAQVNNINIVNALIAAGANVNKSFIDGTTALYEAAKMGGTENVIALIAAGANVNVSDRYLGSTALYEAASRGHENIVNILINAGANISAPSYHGKSVLQFAKEGAFSTRINEVILAAERKWQPATRSSVTMFDAIFDTDAPTDPATGLPTGGRPVAIDTSTCPVCFSFVTRSEACNYMKHDCSAQGKYFHVKLYNKFKNDEGKISWCTVCGRICAGHRHYELSDPIDKRPDLVSYTAGGDFYSNDCKFAGGGGLEEKFKRFRKGREILKRLDSSLKYNEAMDHLVEGMWRAPLMTVPSNTSLSAMQAAKKFTNFPTENFPPNIEPNRFVNSRQVVLGGKKYFYNASNQVFEIMPIVRRGGRPELHVGELALPAIQERFRQFKATEKPAEKYIAPLDVSLLPTLATLSEPIMNPITLDETTEILYFKHPSGAHLSELDTTAETDRVGFVDFFGLLKTNMNLGTIGPCWKSTCSSKMHPDEVEEVLRLAEAKGDFSATQIAEWHTLAKRYRGLYTKAFGTAVVVRAGATGGGQAVPTGAMPAGGAGFGRRTRRHFRR